MQQPSAPLVAALALAAARRADHAALPRRCCRLCWVEQPLLDIRAECLRLRPAQRAGGPCGAALAAAPARPELLLQAEAAAEAEAGVERLEQCRHGPVGAGWRWAGRQRRTALTTTVARQLLGRCSQREPSFCLVRDGCGKQASHGRHSRTASVPVGRAGAAVPGAVPAALSTHPSRPTPPLEASQHCYDTPQRLRGSQAARLPSAKSRRSAAEADTARTRVNSGKAGSTGLDGQEERFRKSLLPSCCIACLSGLNLAARIPSGSAKSMARKATTRERAAHAAEHPAEQRPSESTRSSHGCMQGNRNMLHGLMAS